MTLSYTDKVLKVAVKCSLIQFSQSLFLCIWCAQAENNINTLLWQLYTKKQLS